jgi:hypothetical protein
VLRLYVERFHSVSIFGKMEISKPINLIVRDISKNKNDALVASSFLALLKFGGGLRRLP